MFVADLTFGKHTPRLEKYTMLDSPDKERIEKNWTPIVWNDQVVAMYSLHPLVLADLNGGGRFRQLYHTIHKYDNRWDELLGQLRGSTPLVDTIDGKLGIFHKHIVVDGKRNYCHYWVKLDDNLKVTHVSDPFTFENAQIEFCMGLSIDKALQNATAYYTIMDRMPSSRTYPLDVILFHSVQ